MSNYLANLLNISEH